LIRNRNLDPQAPNDFDAECKTFLLLLTAESVCRDSRCLTSTVISKSCFL